MPDGDVYATARGPLARLASPLAGRARRRRHRDFFALTRLPPGGRILDVGCGRLGLRALEPDLDITGVDLVPRPDYPGPLVVADAAAGLPFADGEFDLVYCSSVIEHVARAPAGADLRRRAATRGPRAGTSRPRRARSRSSRIRCSPLPTGSPCPCADATGASGVAGDWEDISLLAAPRARGPVRARPRGAPGAAREELGVRGARRRLPRRCDPQRSPYSASISRSYLASIGRRLSFIVGVSSSPPGSQSPATR